MKQLLPLLANVAYFFLHYAMMVTYISQDGQNLVAMFQGNIGGLEASHYFVVASQVLVASVSAIALYALSKFPVGIQILNTVLVSGVVISFLGLIGIGAPTVNYSVPFINIQKLSFRLSQSWYYPLSIRTLYPQL